MKATALTIAALFTVFVGAAALAGPGGHGDPQAHIDRLATELGLDDYQAEQVGAILGEQREKYRALHRELRDQGVERGSDEARALREQAQTETRARLATVLTDEQLSDFDELRKQHKHKRHHKRTRGSESDTL